MTPKELRAAMVAAAMRGEQAMTDMRNARSNRDEAAHEVAVQDHVEAMDEFDRYNRSLEASEKVASREAQDAGDVQFQTLAADSMPDYVRAILGDGRVSGRAAEVNEELRDLGTQPQRGGVIIPWPVLERAATTTVQLDGAQNQRPIVGRVFAPSLADYFGASPVQVPQGQTELPVITGRGSVIEQLTEGAAPSADPNAASFDVHTLKPRRLTGESEITVEALAQVPGLEMAIANDTLSAVNDLVSGSLLEGDGAAPNVAGFFSRVAEPADPGARLGLANVLQWPAGSVDGIYAGSEEDISILVGTETYAYMATLFFVSTDSVSSVRWIRNERASLRVSAKMPGSGGTGNAVAQAKRQAVVVRRGQRPNQSFMATWGAGPELVRDPYTKADAGTLRLVWHLLWDAVIATRPAEWRRLLIQHAA